LPGIGLLCPAQRWYGSCPTKCGASLALAASTSRGVRCWALQGSEVRGQGLGCRVRGSGFKVEGLGFKVQGLGSGVWGLGFGVQGVWFRG
jgi:hypothetical protein